MGIEIEKEKRLIDGMTYKQMLELWRFCPGGHPYFIAGSELAEYFSSKMQEKKKQVGDSGHTDASKSIGWGR